MYCCDLDELHSRSSYMNKLNSQKITLVLNNYIYIYLGVYSYVYSGNMVWLIETVPKLHIENCGKRVGWLSKWRKHDVDMTSEDLTDDKSTLVHLMAWCHQATIHNLIQYWLSSLSTYGVARLQWVKLVKLNRLWSYGTMEE